MISIGCVDNSPSPAIANFSLNVSVVHSIFLIAFNNMADTLNMPQIYWTCKDVELKSLICIMFGIAFVFFKLRSSRSSGNLCYFRTIRTKFIMEDDLK